MYSRQSEQLWIAYTMHTVYNLHIVYIYIIYQCLHIVIVLYFTGEFQKAEKICLAYTQKSDVEMSSDAGKSKKRRRTAPTRYRYYFHHNNSPTSNITTVYSTLFLSAIHKLLFSFLFYTISIYMCIVLSFGQTVLTNKYYYNIRDGVLLM